MSAYLLRGNSVGYTLSGQLLSGRGECRGTLFLSSISSSRESNSVGVHSFLPLSKQAEKSAGVHSFFAIMRICT